MTSQIFGDDEKIYGYQDLVIDVSGRSFLYSRCISEQIHLY